LRLPKSFCSKDRPRRFGLGTRPKACLLFPERLSYLSLYHSVDDALTLRFLLLLFAVSRVFIFPEAFLWAAIMTQPPLSATRRFLYISTNNPSLCTLSQTHHLLFSDSERSQRPGRKALEPGILDSKADNHRSESCRMGLDQPPPSIFSLQRSQK